MTNEEKRQQLKEQFKHDLRKRKEFLEKVKGLRHMRKLNNAVSEITGALNDDTDEWIDKLNQGAALDEARFELALDDAGTSESQLEKLAREAEAERFNAQQLVEEMKEQMKKLEDDSEELMEGTENLEDDFDFKKAADKKLGDF